MGNQRRSSKKTGDQVSGEKSAISMFADIMEGSVMRAVDPTACVSFVQYRKPTRSGVDRLKRIFSEELRNGCMGESVNISAGSDAAIVIPLDGSHRHSIRKYLKDLGISGSEIDATMKSKPAWYGIVDGEHRHMAITELIREIPAVWESFMWSVCVVQIGCSMERLRQLSRVQNAKHSEDAWIAVTLHDELSGYRMEFERLLKERNGKKPTAVDVATAYDGFTHSAKDTARQKAATALRLPIAVLDEMGSIMSEEHFDIGAARLPESHPARKDPRMASRYIDCRVFRNFITITSIKQATSFMTATGYDGEKVQVNVLHRIRQHCRCNKYKPVSFKVVSTEVQKATAALEEARKFEIFLNDTNWPHELMTLRTNLLRGKTLDDEVTANKGNNSELLPTLLNEYRELFPHLTALKEAKFKSRFNLHPSAVDVPSAEEQNAVAEYNVPPPEDDGSPPENEEGPLRMNTVPEDTVKEREGKEDNKGPGTELFAGKGSAGTGQSKSKGDQDSTAASARLARDTATSIKTIQDVLLSVGIKAFNVQWQRYISTVYKACGDLFDMILTDPPFGIKANASGASKNYEGNIPDEDFHAFAKFCRSSLKVGGYVFIFTSTNYMPFWKKALQEAGLEVWDSMYVMVKCMKGLQLKKVGLFPQSFTEFGIIARQPGSHEKGFRPDLDSLYHHLSCKLKRRLGVIDSIPVAESKLTFPTTKKIVRVEEKNVGLLMELLTTFCPEGGTIFDAYGGTLTTAIAAMKTV